ncbi:hypothetical protein PG996_000191 [Apiospora saccharicola]|uniref:Uncharacterized protein n=1 Tax=Apiospora saccharicola TaxID=335842 RepID=A0ABR1WG10_9PEZI
MLRNLSYKKRAATTLEKAAHAEIVKAADDSHRITYFVSAVTHLIYHHVPTNLVSDNNEVSACLGHILRISGDRRDGRETLQHRSQCVGHGDTVGRCSRIKCGRNWDQKN